MSRRTRLVTWLATLVLVAGAVVALRATEPESSSREAAPLVVHRFAADEVVLPAPGAPPPPPGRIAVTPGAGLLRLHWADGLAGGSPLLDVVGYDVRWTRADGAGRPGRRLVATPDVQLDGLVDGQRYRIEVRGVDSFGQRSAPSGTTGVPGRTAESWAPGRATFHDDFADPSTVSPDSPGSRWHVSRYRGCVGVGTGRVAGRGLPIDLRCGDDLAVLRARTPLRLRRDGAEELGRVAVRTDSAGPGGELTVDLVPGRADRVGVGPRRAAGRGEERDPSLPGGTVRVSVSDADVRVGAAPDVPAVASTVQVHPAPRRGPGVPHLFEVVLTRSGVRVYQDGLAVAASGVVPRWREASVLLGLRGPAGRRSRVHLAAAGFSGAAGSPGTGVVETPVAMGEQRVLGAADQEPGIGIARTPLVHARAARVVATLTYAPGIDLDRLEVRLGAARLPARPVVERPPAVDGAAVTVVANVPPALLGPNGPATLTPFVLRAPGATPDNTLLETYLEVTPGPGWRAPPPAPSPRTEPMRDALPTVVPRLNNAAGEPLESVTVPRRGQVVLTVELRAAVAQWDTGGVAGVQGVQVRLDGRLIAGIPTRADGPGVGGRYALSIAVGGHAVGNHSIEVRAYGMDGSRRPQSATLRFSVDGA